MEKFFSILFLFSLFSSFFVKRNKAYLLPLLAAPAALPLISAGLSAVPKIFQGITQSRKARKLKPSSYIPPGLEEASNIARTQAFGSRYAGQDVDESNLRQGITDAFHNAAKSTTSPNQLLNVASQLGGAQQRGYQQVGQQLQRFRQGAMDQYRGIQMQKANVQAQNRAQYEAAKSALKGASQQNFYNAATDIGSGIVAALGAKQGAGGDAGLNVRGAFIPTHKQQPRKYFGNIDSLSNFQWNPESFSSFKYNPSSFSAGYHYR